MKKRNPFTSEHVATMMSTTKEKIAKRVKRGRPEKGPAKSTALRARIEARMARVNYVTQRFQIALKDYRQIINPDYVHNPTLWSIPSRTAVAAMSDDQFLQACAAIDADTKALCEDAVKILRARAVEAQAALAAKEG